MDPQGYRQNPTLKKLCHRIIMDHPEAICMAMIVLDCGCLNLCGVSVAGQPAGPMISHCGPPDQDPGNSPVCIQCAGAGGPIMDRIVHRTLIWPGDDTEMPDAALRNLIGREVFGAHYEEPD